MWPDDGLEVWERDGYAEGMYEKADNARKAERESYRRGERAPRAGNRYRKRPVEVGALRWAEDRSNWIECCRYLGDFDSYDESDAPPEFLDVLTLHGNTELLPGDWIVCGPSGDFWPVKADIFAESYEPVPPARPEGAT